MREKQKIAACGSSYRDRSVVHFLVLIFFVVMAMLLAIFSSLIDYRERGLV